MTSDLPSRLERRCTFCLKYLNPPLCFLSFCGFTLNDQLRDLLLRQIENWRNKREIMKFVKNILRDEDYVARGRAPARAGLRDLRATTFRSCYAALHYRYICTSIRIQFIIYISFKTFKKKKRPLGPPKCPKDSFLLNHTTQGSSFILSRYPHVVVAAQNNKTKVL